MRGRAGGEGMPPLSGTFWPARRPSMPRPRHAPARCWPCPPASGWPVLACGQQDEVHTLAPDMAKVSAVREDECQQYPPHRLTSAAMDASFADAVVEQSSQGSGRRGSAPGGGGA